MAVVPARARWEMVRQFSKNNMSGFAHTAGHGTPPQRGRRASDSAIPNLGSTPEPASTSTPPLPSHSANSKAGAIGGPSDRRHASMDTYDPAAQATGHDNDIFGLALECGVDIAPTATASSTQTAASLLSRSQKQPPKHEPVRRQPGDPTTTSTVETHPPHGKEPPPSQQQQQAHTKSSTKPTTTKRSPSSSFTTTAEGNPTPAAPATNTTTTTTANPGLASSKNGSQRSSSSSSSSSAAAAAGSASGPASASTAPSTCWSRLRHCFGRKREQAPPPGRRRTGQTEGHKYRAAADAAEDPHPQPQPQTEAEGRKPQRKYSLLTLSSEYTVYPEQSSASASTSIRGSGAMATVPSGGGAPGQGDARAPVSLPYVTPGATPEPTPRTGEAAASSESNENPPTARIETGELTEEQLEGSPDMPILLIYTGGTIGMQMTANGYAPAPGYLPSVLRGKSEFFEYQDPDGLLVSPPSKYGRRIKYRLLEYEKLIDSSNMEMDDWCTIGRTIVDSYEDYCGFVVMHGTDTMAYTAAALSFMLENLRKTVVLTGSQIPMSEQRNDGADNLLEAMIVASHFQIPEVLVSFGHKVYRGNRTSKLSSEELLAFGSPNMAPIADIGIDITVTWGEVFNPSSAKPLQLHTTLCRDIAIFYVFPGLTIEALESVLMPPMRGVILKTFGAGNFPERREFLDALKRASDAGIVIVNSTQCGRGSVVAAYATGQALLNAGVVPAADMTTEAALAKLAYLLGSNLSVEEVRTKFTENLRGELTTHVERFSFHNADFVNAIASALGTVTGNEKNLIEQALLPVIMTSYAARNETGQIRSLLSNGADPNLADYDNRSALHLACAEGAVETAKLLVESGAAVNSHDRFGHTPLYEAVVAKNMELIELLHSLGGTAGLTTAQEATCLCDLAQQNDQESMALWLAAGVNVNASDYDNRTALHIAAAEGHTALVQWLQERGADPTLCDRWGNVAVGGESKQT